MKWGSQFTCPRRASVYSRTIARWANETILIAAQLSVVRLSLAMSIRSFLPPARACSPPLHRSREFLRLAALVLRPKPHQRNPGPLEHGVAASRNRLRAGWKLLVRFVQRPGGPENFPDQRPHPERHWPAGRLGSVRHHGRAGRTHLGDRVRPQFARGHLYEHIFRPNSSFDSKCHARVHRPRLGRQCVVRGI